MNADAASLEALLTQLVGKECWSLIASPGGRLSLNFGAKVARPRPLRNPHLSEDERNFDGEFSLFVESAWRLDGAASVLSVWSDPIPARTVLHPGTQGLRGARVVSARATGPAWDLELGFEGERWLKVFCDQPRAPDELHPDAPRDNYTVFSPQGSLTVEGGSTLSCEPAVKPRR